MTTRGLFPDKETFNEILAEYNRTPNLYDKQLADSIATRIDKAKKQFDKNLLGLSPSKTYTSDFLEVHFNLRWEEGLEELLIGVAEEVTDPKTGAFLGYKLKIPEQTEQKPAIVELKKYDPISKMTPRNRKTYNFFIKENPCSVKLKLSEIKFPAHFGEGRKSDFLNFLLIASLALNDEKGFYTIVSNEQIA